MNRLFLALPAALLLLIASAVSSDLIVAVSTFACVCMFRAPAEAVPEFSGDLDEAAESEERGGDLPHGMDQSGLAEDMDNKLQIEHASTFQEASPEVLQSRKIIKARRRSKEEAAESAAARPQALGGDLVVGGWVLVGGLCKAVQHNGRIGMIKGSAESGRVCVVLDPDNRELSLKSENVEFLNNAQVIERDRQRAVREVQAQCAAQSGASEVWPEEERVGKKVRILDLDFGYSLDSGLADDFGLSDADRRSVYKHYVGETDGEVQNGNEGTVIARIPEEMTDWGVSCSKVAVRVGVFVVLLEEHAVKFVTESAPPPARYKLKTKVWAAKPLEEGLEAVRDANGDPVMRRTVSGRPEVHLATVVKPHLGHHDPGGSHIAVEFDSHMLKDEQVQLMSLFGSLGGSRFRLAREWLSPISPAVQAVCKAAASELLASQRAVAPASGAPAASAPQPPPQRRPTRAAAGGAPSAPAASAASYGYGGPAADSDDEEECGSAGVDHDDESGSRPLGEQRRVAVPAYALIATIPSIDGTFDDKQLSRTTPAAPFAAQHDRAGCSWQKFSVAEYFAELRVDPAWKVRKKQGNAAMSAGDLQTAADEYLAAASLALGPFERMTGRGTLMAFCRTLSAWAEGSAGAKVAATPELVKNIARFLAEITRDISPPVAPKLPPRVLQSAQKREQILRVPNQAAAICFANRSCVLLQLKRYQEALKDARMATKLCPEYVKGHLRVLRALQALGRTQAAERKQQELDDYDTARRIYPSAEVALLAAGWISWLDASFVYGPVRQREVLKHILNRTAQHPPTISIRVSLVPFQGGQCLLTCLDAVADDGLISVEGYDFVVLDAANDHLCEMPPNGHASERTQQSLFGVIPSQIHNICDGMAGNVGGRAPNGADDTDADARMVFNVDRLVAGQGLVDLVPQLQECLDGMAVRLKMPHLANIHVMPAHSTWAKQVAAGAAYHPL